MARERELGTFEQLLVSPLEPRRDHHRQDRAGAAHRPGARRRAWSWSACSCSASRSTARSRCSTCGMVVYLLAVIGVGLFVSSLAKTQQQAILGAFVFMVPAMLLSGFASPIENMPDWLQTPRWPTRCATSS